MKRLATAIVLLALGPSAHAGTGTFTIGSPISIATAFACTKEDAAITIANLVHDLGVQKAIENSIVSDYIQEGVCGLTGAIRIIPLEVSYDVPVEKGSILKVVMAATQWPPDSQTNIFVIGSNTINGSGIKAVAAEGSI
jgi:hypothetical protein